MIGTELNGIDVELGRAPEKCSGKGKKQALGPSRALSGQRR